MLTESGDYIPSLVLLIAWIVLARSFIIPASRDGPKKSISLPSSFFSFQYAQSKSYWWYNLWLITRSHWFLALIHNPRQILEPLIQSTAANVIADDGLQNQHLLQERGFIDKLNLARRSPMIFIFDSLNLQHPDVITALNWLVSRCFDLSFMSWSYLVREAQERKSAKALRKAAVQYVKVGYLVLFHTHWL